MKDKYLVKKVDWKNVPNIIFKELGRTAKNDEVFEITKDRVKTLLFDNQFKLQLVSFVNPLEAKEAKDSLKLDMPLYEMVHTRKGFRIRENNFSITIYEVYFYEYKVKEFYTIEEAKDFIEQILSGNIPFNFDAKGI